MDAYTSRGELIRLAVLQVLGERPEKEIRDGYMNRLKEIAEFGKLPHNEDSLKNAADFLFEDVKRFKKDPKESLEKCNPIVYQPSLEKIHHVLLETYEASKPK